MKTKTVRNGYDAYVDQAHAGKKHAKNAWLRLESGAEYAFLYLKNPAPRGTSIVTATLRVHAKGESTGSRTLTVRRVATTWDDDTITWNNQPGVTGSNQPTANVGALDDGDTIDFDVTTHLQTVLSGSRHYGWRIETNASAEHMIYGLNAAKYKPVLIVEYTYKPDYASNLSPAGGAVSVAKPTLQFDYHDTKSKSAMAKLRVQIDAAGNFTSPGFDSGWLDATEPELDLSSTGYLGLASGASTQWRVQVQNDDGVNSDWSDPVTFSRIDQGALAITSPAAAPGDVVTEPTPPIAWTFPGQVAWQVRITPANNRDRLLYDSKKQSGADQSWNIPKGIIDTPGKRYSVNVRAWDAQNRVVTPGDPRFAHQWADFTFTYDPTPNPVTGLTVTRSDPAPRLRLTWTRSSTPDSYVIERDGVVIDADLSDLLISGTTYQFDDWGATPWVDHDYRVRPVVNGKACANSPAATGSWKLRSPYLSHPDTGAWFTFLNPSNTSAYGEDATETPKAGVTITRKISSMRGLEGIFTGVLVENDWDPRSLDEQLADVFTIKGNQVHGRFRLVWGDVNIPVIAGNISPALSDDTYEGVPCRALTGSFWQDGELPYTVDV